MSYDATMRVWRGDDTNGGLQDYTVEVNEGEVVLDIIHRLQQTQTPDLAVRWNGIARPETAKPEIIS